MSFALLLISVISFTVASDNLSHVFLATALGYSVVGFAFITRLFTFNRLWIIKLIGLGFIASIVLYALITTSTIAGPVAIWFIIWLLALLPFSLLLELFFARETQTPNLQFSQTPEKISCVIIYYIALGLFTFSTDFFGIFQMDVDPDSLFGILRIITLGLLYPFFAIAYPIFLFTDKENNKTTWHAHVLFNGVAALILGFTCSYNFSTAAVFPSDQMAILAFSLALPLLAIIAARKSQLSTGVQHINDVTHYTSEKYNKKDVAILIPAYNESSGIKPTVDSAIRLVGRNNVFVVNDCSSDDTSTIVTNLGVELLDLKVNLGKAKALETAINSFKICQNFEFLLILDADSEIDPNYLQHALPLFSDQGVAAVAGHAIPKWNKTKPFAYTSFFVAYRVKLYLMTQAFLRYGQTTRHLNVSFIVPGFSSIYRTRILPEIDIAAQGLVIEDFNMTFELHRKSLGRIAYSPKAIAYCDEPHSLGDYRSQIKRWHLGFWQTVKRHGLWRSRFIAALVFFMLESLVISTALFFLPFIVIANIFYAIAPEYIPEFLANGFVLNTNSNLFFLGTLTFLLIDYAGTLVVSYITRIPALAFHGLFFFILRWFDSAYFLIALPMAFIVKSSGRWKSPERGLT